MNTILKAIIAVAEFFGAFVKFLGERRQRQAGADEKTAKDLSQQANRVEISRAARRAIPDGVPDRDSYCRD